MSHEKTTQGREGLSEILKLVRILSDAGDRLPEAMSHVDAGVTHFRDGVGEFQEAAVVIVGRAADERRAAVVLSEEELAAVAELEAKMPRAGGRSGLLSDLFTFIKAHPELLTLLLSFFRK